MKETRNKMKSLHYFENWINSLKKKQKNTTDSQQKWHHWITPLIWEVVGQNQWLQSLNATCQDKNHKLFPQFRGAPGARLTIILLNLWILHRCCFPLLPIASQLPVSLAFCGSLVVKNLPAMQETQVQSLGQEESLEKEMATHSSILAWRIPRTEEPGGLQFRGSQRVGHDWGLSD